MYLFPFEKIEKNSRIVLYAAGIIGKQYYAQIRQTNFCEVLLWLDLAADGVTTQKPETITTLKPSEYDFVVIALTNSQVDGVKKLMLDFGVPEHKIICEGHSYTPVKSTLILADFLQNDNITKTELIKYFYESQASINYFIDFMDEIKNADDAIKKQVEAKALQICERTDLSIEPKLVLIRAIYGAMIIPKALLKKFVELAGQMQSLSLKYWLLVDITLIWFFNLSSLYDGFFTQLRKLVEDYARDLQLTWQPPKRISNNRTICVLTINLENTRSYSAQPDYISPIVKALEKKEYKIHIIDVSAQRSDAGYSLFNPHYLSHTISKNHRKELLDFYPENMELHYITNATMKDRQQDILDLICTINPIYIMDFTSSFSFVSYYYSKIFPTVYFPLRKAGGDSSTFFHKYVITSSDYIEIQPPLTEDQIIRLPERWAIVPPKRQFNRAEFGLANEDIVIVSVGGRLAYEITHNLAEQMCQLIRQNPHVKWLIVGITSHDYITKHYQTIIGSNIIFIAYEEDLIGLYGICDIYLNPHRVGGGTSVQYAVQQGLAVVSTVGGDAQTRSLGRKNCVNTENDLIPFIENLILDSELLVATKEKIEQISKTWSMEIWLEKFLVEMDKFLTEFYEKEQKQ
ncbi:MAG: glycosyltransferase [Turicibacter sp.]|nr:glycosyltransferase [Turicibacter sp.]